MFSVASLFSISGIIAASPGNLYRTIGNEKNEKYSLGLHAGTKSPPQRDQRHNSRANRQPFRSHPAALMLISSVSFDWDALGIVIVIIWNYVTALELARLHPWFKVNVPESPAQTKNLVPVNVHIIWDGERLDLRTRRRTLCRYRMMEYLQSLPSSNRKSLESGKEKGDLTLLS